MNTKTPDPLQNYKQHVTDAQTLECQSVMVVSYSGLVLQSNDYWIYSNILSLSQAGPVQAMFSTDDAISTVRITVSKRLRARVKSGMEPWPVWLSGKSINQPVD